VKDEPVRDEVEGGESSCYAHLLCTECGVVLDGSAHLATCSSFSTNVTAKLPHPR
jgi:hypothetical protein